MNEFTTEKSLFGTEIFYTDDTGRYRICNIVHLEDQKQLEIQTPFFENKTQSEPILLEISLQKNREVEMIYHNVNIPENSFIFNGFYNFKEIKTGKTLPQISKNFIGKKTRYKEAFSTCRFGTKTIYYFVRKKEDNLRDEYGNIVKDEFKDVFLIGAYLYDPTAEKEDLFPVLQLIYCSTLDFEEIKLASLEN